MSAQYLLRFDDLCPTMRWDVWQHIENILIQEGVQPVLAVIPDNRDPTLCFDAPRPDFWERVRSWQARGWTIGLHGYQHRYLTTNSGLIGRNKYSEFAGLTPDEQASKLTLALKIFQGEQVRADLWIAPAHSYDETTLDLLDTFDIRALSDGYALYPYLDCRGIFCIPQQIGRFYRMPFGFWTVCMHPNGWTAADLKRFETDVRKFKSHITNLKQISQAYSGRSKQISDDLFAGWFRAARALRP
ncbi:MAG: DUF2334 domain-containing protein [Acidobacteriota bacterium]|nr:DUF2334 domain-containing protein [Acidobacteriota bacterium]